MDKESLSHTRANCKYHIVFTPKYRRQVIYGQLKKDKGEIIRTLCERKGITIIEAAACKDHIHMYVEIPPKYSVAEIMGYLKGKSSLMIFERHANLKYKYGNRHFWCKGYYVDTVGRNEKKIAEYVRNQLQEDQITDQIGLQEYFDPFTGEPERKGKKYAALAAARGCMRLADCSRAFRPSRPKALIGPVQATRYAGGLD